MNAEYYTLLSNVNLLCKIKQHIFLKFMRWFTEELNLFGASINKPANFCLLTIHQNFLQSSSQGQNTVGLSFAHLFIWTDIKALSAKNKEQIVGQ